jgi:hypothetical protein
MKEDNKDNSFIQHSNTDKNKRLHKTKRELKYKQDRDIDNRNSNELDDSNYVGKIHGKISHLNKQDSPKFNLEDRNRESRGARYQSRPRIRDTDSPVEEDDIPEQISEDDPFSHGSDIDHILDVPVIEASNRNFSTIIGDKPNVIDNTDIEGENEGQLKQNIQLNRDFILLPKRAWELLLEWYNGGPEFPRKVIVGKDSKPTIELHPPLISAIL